MGGALVTCPHCGCKGGGKKAAWVFSSEDCMRTAPNTQQRKVLIVSVCAQDLACPASPRLWGADRAVLIARLDRSRTCGGAQGVRRTRVCVGLSTGQWFTKNRGDLLAKWMSRPYGNSSRR